MQDAIQQTETTTCSNTFQISQLPGKCLIILSGHSMFPNIHGEVGINKHLPGVLQLFKLCAAAVSSRFLYKWKKSPSPLSSPEIHCFNPRFPMRFHRLKSWTMSQYKNKALIYNNCTLSCHYLCTLVR